MTRRPEAPCKDCEDRHTACHDECDKYQLFKRELTELKLTIFKETHNEADIVAHLSKLRNMDRQRRGVKDDPRKRWRAKGSDDQFKR